MMSPTHTTLNKNIEQIAPKLSLSETSDQVHLLLYIYEIKLLKEGYVLLRQHPIVADSSIDEVTTFENRSALQTSQTAKNGFPNVNHVTKLCSTLFLTM
jgi:CRISPR/Cas system-associated endonuclease/helicase Cas3